MNFAFELTRGRGRPMLEPMNKVGAFCRKRRVELGWNLREAAERSGLSYSEISAIERGERRDMTLSTSVRMADLFGIDGARFTAAVILANQSEDDPDDPRTLEDILATLDIREERGDRLPCAV